MTVRSRTFTVHYNYFEPGTLVTPTSTRSTLKLEHVYRVHSCSEPCYPEDRAICFVSEHSNGKEHRYGVTTEYLREVAIGELTDDQLRLKRPNFWYTGDEA